MHLVEKEAYHSESVLKVLNELKLYKAEAMLLSKMDREEESVKAYLNFLLSKFSRTKVL